MIVLFILQNSSTHCAAILTNILILYRAATAALVEKQSHEMLELINEKRSEYMMAESLYVDGMEEGGFTDDLPPYPSLAPIPSPPALSKFQIYSDPIEFANVDQIAISVSGLFFYVFV